MKSSQRLIALSLALGLGCGAALAQIRKPGDPLPAEPQTSEPFADTVNVSVVNVDVYVTDKQGNPVTGLTRADFELFENKRPVEISNFYAVNNGKAVAPPEPPAAVAAAEPAAPASPASPPQADLESVRTPEDQRLRLIIYIDNFNLRPFNRNRVMRELRVFLHQNLGKDDQVMLATFDRELHIRRTFTSDPGIITAALSELEKISAQGVHADSERREAMDRIEESRSVVEAENYARTYAESQFNDLSFSIDGLKKVTDSLAGIPGRKAVVYVSDGLQMIAGQDVFYAVQNKYGEQTTAVTKTLQFDVSRRLGELAAQANANRITFYTIDAAGLRVYESTSAEVRGSASAPGLTQIVESVRFANLQSSLQLMAEKTGGQAVINTNVFMPALDRMARDFRSYYSLGYTPSHFGDGRYYRIEVKVKGRKDLEVRHREGYRDKSVEARMNDGTVAALNFAFDENPLGVSLSFGLPKRRDDGFFVVPVEVKIPLGKLVLVPREQTQTEDARVRLFIAAIDANGSTSDVQNVPLPISIPKAEVATAVNKHYTYSVSLLMRSGDQRVAVGVRDDVAAQASFVSRGLSVGGR